MIIYHLCGILFFQDNKILPLFYFKANVMLLAILTQLTNLNVQVNQKTSRQLSGW